MLNPNSRCVYLAELRPPAGFTLDRAIAATFSLDLLALLMAPVSMVFSDLQREESLQDPVALLESLRQTAGRFAVFCQEGRISIPKADTLLYNYLERAVVEVQPPGRGVFHPKVWVLRFLGEGNGQQVTLYRFLCLTRNLTFDYSWDTVLVLEGRLAVDRKNAYSRNRPLSDFIRSLPDMAVRGITPEIQEHIDIISDEILRVQFQPPEGFEDEFRFLPVGIKGYRRLPELDHRTRLLVISPFLSDEVLKPMVERGKNNILLSRPESLDALNEETYNALINSGTSIYIMDHAAEKPENELQESENGEEESSAEDLSGLHAKFYILEDGWDARVWTGSANATKAAFSGVNVEFLVELQGRRSKVGIEPFLGKDEEPDAFNSLVHLYRRPDNLEHPDPAEQRLEMALNDARTAVTEAGLSLEAHPAEDKTWSLLLNTTRELFLGEVTGRCCPVTIRQTADQPLEPLLLGDVVIFQGLSPASLTSFMAFKLTARAGGRTAALNFVLNLPIRGLPEHRNQAILQNIISKRERFFRYLLLLLSEGDENGVGPGILNAFVESNQSNGVSSYDDITLLEELVRAFSRAPEKIDRIAKLVEDLQDTEEGSRLVPPEFEQIWGAFLSLRQGGVSR